MKLIAHRGNLDGPVPEKENHPDYITAAVVEGYEVEIDLWRVGSKWVLGHDEPQHEIGERYLATYSSDSLLWIHTKNVEALEYLTNDIVYGKYPDWNYFWHQEDDYVLTSFGYIWAYPGKKLTNNTICVLPEQSEQDILDLRLCKGICTDYIYEYEKLLDEQNYNFAN